MIEEIPVEERKYDEHCGKFYKDTRLEVLYFKSLSKSQKKYFVKCHDCYEKDQELYGDSIFPVFLQVLKKSGKPCGCAKNHIKTKSQYEIILNRMCRKSDIVFLGFIKDENSPTVKSKTTKVCCRQGEEIWSTQTVGQIISQGATNPYDANRRHLAGEIHRRDDEMFINRFFDTGVYPPGTIFARNLELRHKPDSRNPQYPGGRGFWDVFCPECKEVNTTSTGSLRLGGKPCSCAKPLKYAYILMIDKSYLKFGVTTSNSNKRVIQLSAKTNLEIEQLSIWEFPNKSQCLAAERYCKRNLTCGVISKRDLGSGFTETTYMSNLESIIETYLNFGGVRL